MHVHHQDFSPVLIIGHGSSGTSILSRLLRNYLKISFGTESQFIIRYYQALKRYGDLNDDQNLKRLIQHLIQERWFQRCHKKWNFKADPHRILADVRERTYRGVLDSIFGQLAKHNQMAPRWGDKTPAYVQHLDVLWELFPDAKYIHLIRDGRDVALSAMGRYWGPQNIFTAALRWNRDITRIDNFAKSVPPHQFCEISYESLLSDPVETFRQTISFLKIDDTDGTLIREISERLPQDLMRSNYDKWRTRLSEKQRIQFEKIAGACLRRHGYETVIHEDGPPPSVVQEFYWMCDDRIRKWTYRDYWKDNWYKLKMRSRDALHTAGLPWKWRAPDRTSMASAK